MLFNLLNISLFIGCFILANALHTASKKDTETRFEQVDFLFACLIYLFSFERLAAVLEWSNVGMLMMGFQLYMCVRLIICLRNVMPNIFDNGINKYLFVPRSKEQIREQVLAERGVVL